MWLCTGFVFAPLKDQPFQFFIFHYTNMESDLGLCGFLSFLVATAAAQTVNFFVQKNLVFKSDARFCRAVPKYVLLAVVLVIISAALPAYSQEVFVRIGIPQGIGSYVGEYRQHCAPSSVELSDHEILDHAQKQIMK